MSVFGSLDEIPIIIEEAFTKDEETLAKPDITNYEGSLFIFVHGFKGSALDMQIMKNVMTLRFPGIQTLCSSSNEQNTEGDIEEMGIRLAKEINNFIKEWFKKDTLKKIIFFGHSLGGIIIRSALPNLADHKDKMHLLITFSTPHLGCL